MDINQIVAELEDQAARYAQAANALRTLLPLKEPAIPAVVRQAIAPKSAARAANGKGKSANSGKKKSAVSDETRAKISAAVKAAHERRKAAAADS